MGVFKISCNEQVGDSIINILNKNKLYISLQRIVHLRTRKIRAYELLTRVQDRQFTPRTFFAAARKAGIPVLLHVERVIERALVRLRSWLPPHTSLHVNIHPAALPYVHRLPLGQPWSYGTLVVEITERAVLGKRHRQAIRLLRNTGKQIAIDDAGAGWNSLWTIMVIRPEVVKIDLRLVRRYRDPRVRRIIATILAISQQSGAHTVIAEGVESEEQATWLTRMGIDCAQGSLFGLEDARYSLHDGRIVWV